MMDTARNGDRQAFSVLGKRNVPGRLSYTIATGKAQFGTDVVVPNMLFAKFLRCPYGHARITSLDVSKAKSLPGVAEVLTWEDPEIKAMPLIGGMPLLDNHADMEDEEVGAVVVAESLELCDLALSLLQVEWEVLPHILDPRDGLRPDAPLLWNDPRVKGNVTPTSLSQGDIEAGFKQADHTIEFDWTLSLFSSHLPNPSGAVSWWDDNPLGSEGPTLHIEGISPAWGGSMLRPMYKLPFDKIERNSTFQGGKYCDFGVRRAALITPLLARRTGRPVRAVNARQHDYDVALPQRHIHVKVGFKDDGTITAVHDTVVGDAGVRGTSMFLAIDLRFNPFYTTQCQNLKTDSHAVFTNTGRMYTSGQTWPFNWDGLTIAEQLIAEKLGMDPVDVALKNIDGPSSQNHASAPPSFQLCLDEAKKKVKWQWHPAGTKKLADGRMHGASFRYHILPRHAEESYSCTVTIQRDGRVCMPLKGPWSGNYSADACAMVVAEELGAKLEDVVLGYDAKPLSTVGAGSDGSTASAWVCKQAAVACKKLLLKIAASRFKAKPEDLDTRDSMVYLKSDPSTSLPFSAFPGSGEHDKGIAATFTGRPPVAAWNTGQATTIETVNVTFCEVAVDKETGLVEVLKYVIATDVGKILRPTSLESQIYQVMILSDGTALSEEFVFDKASGVKLSTNMIEYKKPTMLDITPVEATMLESRAGSAGSGVSHSLATTQLIVCAVANAIGKWIAPPLTPDKVLRALGKA